MLPRKQACRLDKVSEPLFGQVRKVLSERLLSKTDKNVAASTLMSIGEFVLRIEEAADVDMHFYKLLRV